jgi:outer membrane protein OmpA-like peptidoglycan-associated protein
LLFIVIISGCSGTTTVILLPDPDGHVGNVIVSTTEGTIDISKSGEAVVVRGSKSVPDSPEVMSEQEIQKDFGEVLTRLPAIPVHYILYFNSESTRLTVASKKTIPDILAAIEDRESLNISVVGHTDTAGDEEYNRQLSLKRARSVRTLLIKRGVDPESIETSSHGEHNLLVKTGDNTHEPKNRRVEVVVR